MDTLRGQFGSFGLDDDPEDYPIDSDDTGRELPPSPIGQDERRMQVRAYNHWASQLVDRTFPSIEDLEPAELPDFGPYSVLLDFTHGIEDPSIRFLGTRLAEECGAQGAYERLSDVPSRSLLSRITDHYMQILANQAPIGFEAEFVNQRGATILYRGILLPYSSDDQTIDFIYGVINWKELADQLTTDELLLEIDQALAADDDAPVGDHAALPPLVAREPIQGWADGPDEVPATDDPFPVPSFDSGTAADTGAEPLDLADNDDAGLEAIYGDAEGDLYEAIEATDEDGPDDARFASLLSLGGAVVSDDYDEDEPFGAAEFGEGPGQESVAEFLPRRTARAKSPLDLTGAMEVSPASEAEADSPPRFDGERDFDARFGTEHADNEDYGFASNGADIDVGSGTDGASLYDCLAEARELALAARSSEDRSRGALYAAVGRAYDVSLAAAEAPEEFAELVTDSGLTMQDRAPMTPVVKLVFGADYDKTRLTEYAAVLTHAHRVGVARGTLADYLGKADGGLKGVVQSERALRRAEQGEPARRETPREALARKLRAIAPLGFEDIAEDGPEFALVMIRRDGAGNVVVVGEIADDVALIEKAGRKLVA